MVKQQTTPDVDALFAALRESDFRQRFQLGEREKQYLVHKGTPRVLQHAANFIAHRLAPAQPVNDGKQTPMRGHPVFVAQHATATCCRSCLEKWHGIPRGRELTNAEQRYVVDVIARWLAPAAAKVELNPAPDPDQPTLF